MTGRPAGRGPPSRILRPSDKDPNNYVWGRDSRSRLLEESPASGFGRLRCCVRPRRTGGCRPPASQAVDQKGPRRYCELFPTSIHRKTEIRANQFLQECGVIAKLLALQLAALSFLACICSNSMAKFMQHIAAADLQQLHSSSQWARYCSLQLGWLYASDPILDCGT